MLALFCAGVELNPGPAGRGHRTSANADKENCASAHLTPAIAQSILEVAKSSSLARGPTPKMTVPYRKLKDYKNAGIRSHYRHKELASDVIRVWRANGGVDVDASAVILASKDKDAICEVLRVNGVKLLGCEISSDGGAGITMNQHPHHSSHHASAAPMSTLSSNQHENLIGPQPSLLPSLTSISDSTSAFSEVVGVSASDDVIDISGPAALDPRTRVDVDQFCVNFDRDELMDGREVLQLFAVETGQSLANMDFLLKLLHRFKPEFHYNTLPQTAKTLLKPDKHMVDSVVMRPMKAYVIEENLLASSNPAGQVASSRNGDDEEGAATSLASGDFAYFGIENAILARSPGLNCRQEHLMLLRRIHAAHPDVLSRPLLRVAYGDDDSAPDVDDDADINDGADRPWLTKFVLLLHVDGVTVYENSQKAGCHPIMASISAVARFDPVTLKCGPGMSFPMVLVAFIVCCVFFYCILVLYKMYGASGKMCKKNSQLTLSGW